MSKSKEKSIRRNRRRISIRKRIEGTPGRPRLSVYKSLNHTYAQIVDDLAGKTLVAASTIEKDLGIAKTGNTQAAAAVGSRLAERATKAGIKAVVFDRSGFRYHGRLKSLAEAARKGGLQF